MKEREIEEDEKKLPIQKGWSRLHTLSSER